MPAPLAESAAEGAAGSRRRGVPIDLVIADKSPLVLNALRQLLGDQPEFNVVATAADGERFLEAVDRFEFDIGVIGWNMPFLGGREVLKALQAVPQAPRIVVYTGNASLDVPRQVMELGGAGFCHKSELPERLVRTISEVAAGRMVFPFVDVRRIGEDPLSTLTARERELLAALARGRSNAGIARDLGISLHTVKFHLKNLYEKLGARNRAEAVARYLTVQSPH